MLVNMVKKVGEIQPAAMYEHDAAKYLKLSVNDLRKFVHEGRIIARKHPGRSRRIYLKSDLDEYLQSLEKEGVA